MEIKTNIVSLEEKIAALEQRLQQFQQTQNDLQIATKEKKNSQARFKKRSLAISAVALGLCGSTALAAAFGSSSGAALQQFIQLAAPVAIGPLDTMIAWARPDSANVPAGYTNEIVSLVADGSQTNSYQWPLYIELRGTTSPAANQDSSQSVGATVRAFNRSAGSPWLAGFHSEIAHGRMALTSGDVVATHGTSLLFNGEMRSYATTGITTGVNLQCVYTDANSRNCNNAINVQAGSAQTVWQNGLHFDSNGNYITGNIGVNFDQSHYNMGIDLANNSMRMNAGQKIILERNGTIYIWVNPRTGNIELVKNNHLVQSW